MGDVRARGRPPVTAPTYTVEPAKGGGCKFLCPPCGRHHYHSMPGIRPEHRVAHCAFATHHPCGYFLARPAPAYRAHFAGGNGAAVRGATA